MELTPIEAAATWWARALGSVCGPSTGSYSLDVLIGVRAPTPLRRPEQGAFVVALRTELERRLATSAEVHLVADREPDAILAEAYAAARPGVSPACAFPVRTAMRISRDRVEVRSGVGAAWERIYPSSPPLARTRVRTGGGIRAA